MFTITGGKGFWMEFANGWTVSVQWGYGNYCEGRYSHPMQPAEDHSDHRAEVARWKGDRDTMDEPFGWQTPEEVAAFIAETASF